MKIGDFIYPSNNTVCNEPNVKLQPDKTWIKYAEELVDNLCKEGEEITLDEATTFLWDSIKAALDMITAKKTYAEYIFETALRGIPKWAQLSNKTWKSLKSELRVHKFLKYNIV